MANDRVFVYDLEKQDVRAVPAKDIENTYCGKLGAHRIGTIPIGKGSRKVDVVLKGSIDTNEVEAHVATVTIPFNIMVQRCMGHFKEIVITTDRCSAPGETNHHC